MKSAIFLLGAALALNVVTAHADDLKPTRHRRHHAKVEKATPVVKHARPARAVLNKSTPTQDGRNSEDTMGNAAGVANGPEYRVPTGSHIPRRYNRRGTTTDSYDNTTIIDQNDQRFQQHTTPSEILRTVPGLQVSGPRGL